MKNYKILCTGNPEHRGLAQELQKIFSNIDFISRTNGYDLRFTNVESENLFREKLKNYNVLINYAYCDTVGAQCKILEIAREVWDTGYVINIGSHAEYPKFNHADPIYAKDKLNLRNLSIELGDQFFKTTHIVAGAFLTKQVYYYDDDIMHPSKVANVVKYVLDADFQIPIISVEEMSKTIKDFFDNCKKD